LISAKFSAALLPRSYVFFLSLGHTYLSRAVEDLDGASRRKIKITDEARPDQIQEARC
jgi:hypothetical protein